MSAASPQRIEPEHFGFLLMPRFSSLPFTSAMEMLRAANRISGKPLYSWSVIAPDSEPAVASSGVRVLPDFSVEQVERIDNLIVVAGMEPERLNDKRVFNFLRRIARQGSRVGAVSTGSYVLARCGLLDGYRCTIHWENIPGFQEEFPQLEVTDELFEIDRNRMTCAGEAASTDLMLTMLAAAHGNDVASTAAAQVLHARVRSPIEPQASLALRTGTRNRHLLKAIAMMEGHRDELLSIELIAHEVGCSRRQLERIFKEEAGCSPVRHYRNLRLDRARQLYFQPAKPACNKPRYLHPGGYRHR